MNAVHSLYRLMVLLLILSIEMA